MSEYGGGRRAERRGQATPPAGLAALLASLKTPSDFWDRPDGDWPGCGDGIRGSGEARAHANACYRLGSRALRRGDLTKAANWLSTAAQHDHPGALFRLAVVVHRQLGPEGRADAQFLVAMAAEAGHGDARVLLEETGVRSSTPDGPWGGQVQDEEFIAEVRTALGRASRHVPAPQQAGPPDPGSHAARAGMPSGADSGPAPEHGNPWSVNPLRAPGLTVAARQVPGRSPAPERWRMVERSLRILHTLHGSSVALSQAQLVKATSLPKQVLERLLHWLCSQGLAQWLSDGGFVPGPVLGALTDRGPGMAAGAIEQTLAALRDAVGAAVYVSRYADGEINISRYSAGPHAPQVYEWVDFKASAHASAVGKSLLAQLSYAERMDHLSRHRTARLTSRTITEHKELFQDIDGRGPNAAQFDRQEYSTREVCVAIPLHGGGQADCLALSLPVAQQHRLEEAARILSRKSNAVLLSLLLAGDPPVEQSTQLQNSIVVVPPLEWTQKPQDSVTLVPPAQAILIPHTSRTLHSPTDTPTAQNAPASRLVGDSQAGIEEDTPGQAESAEETAQADPSATDTPTDHSSQVVTMVPMGEACLV
ncbi:IclR family transcriptional regulator C-terminal domain-containing protein [Streptomyces sp. NPDC001581]|uniref:IclR family transcriptional regulator domain-containing protein n=1 Tax=Streptomyces sp. NPDC001581 TaxID=3154386 RepID=UPI0033278144